MTKEKKEKLVKYLNGLKSRLEDGIPNKHKDHPETFLAFLKREIRVVEAQLEAARLDSLK